MAMLIPEAWSRQPGHGRGQARLLRVPRLADGAVGRPGGDRLHRWPRDRRNAGPQRLAPRPLHRHQGRSGGAGLRGRRARRAGRRCAQEGPLAAGPHVPGGYGAEAHHLRRRDQEAVGRPPALRRLAQGAAGHAGSVAGAVAGDRVQPRDPAAPPARLRLQRRRPEDPAGADGRNGRGADRLHGHRCAAGLPV